jgi:cell division protein FtsQ
MAGNGADVRATPRRRPRLVARAARAIADPAPPAGNWTDRTGLALCARREIPAGSGGRRRTGAVVGGFGGRGAGAGVAAENRRRVDPAVQAELRQARRARVRLAAIAIGGLLLAGGVLSAAWHYLTNGAALQIAEIRFSGLARATPDELAALSPVRPGDNVFAADLRAMERALATHPWVRAARVARRLPRALEVRVEERAPLAVVELGGLYLVDRDAVPFKRAQPGDGLDLPLVTGLSRDDYVERRAELEPVLAGALALVERYAVSPLGARAPVSEVHVDLESGTTIYVGEAGTQVRLGTGDLPQKLARLERTLDELARHDRRAEVVHLDNRVRPSWVTVRVAGGGSDPAGVSPGGSKAGGKGSRGL